jgi:hypothetical protein
MAAFGEAQVQLLSLAPEPTRARGEFLMSAAGEY